MLHQVTLTRRRTEFLAKILRLFEAMGEPVHYTAVAEALGVSKWTAYDMLKALEEDGFLDSVYAVNREERVPGRSMVVFRPTERAWRWRENGGPECVDRVQAIGGGEWSAIRKELLGLLDQVKSGGARKVIDELLDTMPAIERPVALGAYTIVLLIVYLEHLGARGLATVQNILHAAARPEITLSLFAGTAIGSAIRGVKDSLHKRIEAQVRRFLESIGECNAREGKLLVGFLRQALERSL
ncbi:helix-turn-helix domain-containing protein [Desulforudis sp. 1088]|uniref:helix-turn-helix domain-containing protein n=1 Tax=unclassified Candidatus Desulforudis TaxID=2635950 RepID=UPI003CE4D000